MLLGILDDRSRVCCHCQLCLGETTGDLVHGFSQALLKRGLPRAAMSDTQGSLSLPSELQPEAWESCR